MSHTYPKRAINSLAVNPVSLKDVYHLENMEILAQNQEIGNFLYAVMTNPQAIKRRNYRSIIREMIENKNNIGYVFLVCYYAIGEQATVQAQNILERNYFYEIDTSANFRIGDTAEIELLKNEVIEGLFEQKYELQDTRIFKINRNIYRISWR